MKKLFITLVVLCISLQASYAQTGGNITVTPQVLPPYSTYLPDYLNSPNRVLVNLLSFSNANIKLKVTITGDNGISVMTSDNYTPPTPIVLTANQPKMLSGLDLKNFLDVNSAIVTGINKNELFRGSGIPEGNYTLCVQALDYNTGVALSQPEPMGCSNTFQILQILPPQLLSPYCDDEIEQSGIQNIIFTWLPSPGANPNAQYKLRIAEMIPGSRNPNEAMFSSTTPLFFETSTNIPSFVYGPAQPKLRVDRKYAWQVELLADNPFNSGASGNPQNIQNNGRSEVCVFQIKTTTQVIAAQDSNTNASGFDPGVNINTNQSPGDDLNLDFNAGGTFNLSHAYKSDDGGIFYLTVNHVNDYFHEFYFYGEHPTKGYAVLYSGKLNMGNNKEKMGGNFTFVPKYEREGSGILYLDIKEKGQKFIVDKEGSTESIPFSSLEAINLNDYIHMLPPAQETAKYEKWYNKNFSFEGLFIGADQGFYHAVRDGSKFYMVGEPKFEKGQKPSFSKVFIGDIEELSDKLFEIKGVFFTTPKGQLDNKFVQPVTLRYKLSKKEPKLNLTPLSPFDTAVTNCAIWSKVKPEGNYFGEEPVELLGDSRPPITATKSASLIFYYFSDGPLLNVFQNVGINLQHTMDGYDKVCLLKKWYSDLNKDPDYHDQPTKANFFKYLKQLADEGYFIDIFVFTHGYRTGIETLDDEGVITSADIKKELGNIYQNGKFPIRMVYQMNCHGSKLNDAFTNVGAKAVVGSRSVNFMPTRFNTFGRNWQKNKGFSHAVYKSKTNKTANAAAIVAIDLELKAKTLKPLSWDCKSCFPGTLLYQTKDCIGCFFKSFYGIAWSEYDLEKSGSDNLRYFSEPIMSGTSITLKKSTIPTW